MNKRDINKKMAFYYLYTFVALFLPLIVEFIGFYDFSDGVFVGLYSCFFISVFVILADEDKKLVNMLKKEYPDLYTNIINEKTDAFAKADSSGWTNANKSMQNALKEKFPEYWEYYLKLVRYFFVSFGLMALAGIINMVMQW